MFSYSKLAETFDYKNPTKKIFAGRAEEIQQFDRFSMQPGAQIVVYGNRSIGKTSFVHHVLRNKNYIKISCHKNDDFESIFKRLFRELNEPERRIFQTKSKASMGGLIGIEGDELKEFQVQSYDPDSVASFFSKTDLVEYVFFDEFDLIIDQKTKEDFALLMKFFSDRVLRTKIILAGIADNVTGLIMAHESSTRFLSAIHLDKMKKESLVEILNKGEQILSIKFSPLIIERITTLSEGFPFYVHLLAFGVLENLADKKEVPSVIEESRFEDALNFAYHNANHKLRHTYETSIDRKNTNSELSEYVLWVCAEKLYEEEVLTKDILERVKILSGNEDFKQQNLSNYLGRFRRDKVLTRVREGRYRFTDPLMKIFINVLRRQQPSQGQFFPT